MEQAEQLVSLSELEENLGYKFTKKSYLLEALTHSTYANEHRSKEHNERLEFLGDSVLSLVVSSRLFDVKPSLKEGVASKLRSKVVCEETLCLIAKKLELSKFLFLGKGEKKSGGDTKPSILADAMEAIFAAIYLDTTFKKTSEVISNLLDPYIKKALSGQINYDFKSQLLERLQENGNIHTISFVVKKETGPAHDKCFFVCLEIDQKPYTTGEGRTKKEAAQVASKKMLEYLNSHNDLNQFDEQSYSTII